MLIPHSALDAKTLLALIEDFVTRDGAVHGHQDTSLDAMITTVRRQLETGTARIVYDEETETCTIVRSDP